MSASTSPMVLPVSIMEKQRIVVTYKASAEEKALLQQVLGEVAALEFLAQLAPAQREAALRSATVLLAWNLPKEVPAREYPSLAQVRLIQLLSAGVDRLPWAELPPEIVVAGNVGAYAGPMAEHTVGLILALAKRLCVESQKLRQGEWDKFTPTRLLAGRTAGILGFGGIGRATARLLRALDLRIWALNTTGSTAEPVDFIGTLPDLEQVLRAADVVVISLPLTRATRGLIGKPQLDWMKPDAILINVSRGDILDEDALYAHVRDHPDFLVGLDAWWNEPWGEHRFQMKHPFLDLPNVLGSPHNSAVVPHIWSIAARPAAENIQRYLTGGSVTGIARREDYL